MGTPPNEDSIDVTTSSDSINYRRTLDFMQEQLYHNASTHDKIHPDDLPGLRSTFDQEFCSITDDNEFNK